MAIPRKALTLKRFNGAGDFNSSGKWVEGDSTTSTILASVQPTTGEEMELLPEGRRDSQSYRLYTSSQLFTAKTSPRNQADIVIIGGVNFEVLVVEDWQNNIINHYKAIVVQL